jgi:YbbR domain-containing protein
MDMTNTPTQEVDIVVTGGQLQVERLNERDLIVSVDLTDVKSGDRIIQLSPETVNLDLPSGIKLDEIQPNKIAIRLEKVEEREVAVKVETEGSVDEGFEIYETNVLPAKVRVRGAESFVKSLDSVTTEKINIDNLKENFFARQIGLNVVNPKVTLLDTIVDVSFKIGEKRIERAFTVFAKNGNETASINIVLYGSRSILDKIKPEDIQVSLEMENEKLVPKATLPADLQDSVEIKSLKKN